MRRIVLLTIALMLFSVTYAQLENPKIRRGNRLYKKGKYAQAEAQYSLALKKNPDSYIAKNNLGLAFYKEKNDSSALATLMPLTSVYNPNPLYRSQTSYNLGDILTRIAGDSLQAQNINGAMKYLEKAVRAYRNAIKFNPDDYQARYNLWVVQKLLDQLRQQQKNKSGGGSKKKQNQQKDKQNNNQQKQNQQNQQQNNQNKNQQNQNQQNQQQNQNQQQKFQGLSPKEMERMLRAVSQQDKRVQQKALRNLMNVKRRKKTDKNW